jgi:hypothetical protein
MSSPPADWKTQRVPCPTCGGAGELIAHNANLTISKWRCYNCAGRGTISGLQARLDLPQALRDAIDRGEVDMDDPECGGLIQEGQYSEELRQEWRRLLGLPPDRERA